MKTYISGAITDQPDGNRPAFEAAEQMLRALGHDPVNPHKLNHVAGSTWEQYMRLDIAHLVQCDAIVMLSGWERSRGARLEAIIARDLDMPIWTLEGIRAWVVAVNLKQAELQP